MTEPRTNLLSLWRRFAAARRGRALVAVLAVAVFGWQLALQGHVLGHDLEALDGPCSYALQVHQATPLASAVPRIALDRQVHAAPESPVPDLSLTRAPLTERSRGPPQTLA